MKKAFVLAFTALFITELSMALEEPKYTVIETDDMFELRSYEPLIVAQTLVSGDMDGASNAGFKLIAGYIFGGNVSKNAAIKGDNDKISMTAPVSIQAQTEKIAMTVPVSMQQEDGQWLVHFVMPSQYTMETLPTPKDPRVTLRQIPARNYAAITFSGFTGPIKVSQKTAQLMAWLKAKGIEPISEPEMARYNAPWSLPFMRRNEVMVRY
ncbi:MAG: heme-binding protein [Oceanospirillaceae bacterium]|nr:heme-binding protein [Oceanospirillaceae bacterium]